MAPVMGPFLRLPRGQHASHDVDPDDVADVPDAHVASEAHVADVAPKVRLHSHGLSAPAHAPAAVEPEHEVVDNFVCAVMTSECTMGPPGTTGRCLLSAAVELKHDDEGDEDDLCLVVPSPSRHEPDDDDDKDGWSLVVPLTVLVGCNVVVPPSRGAPIEPDDDDDDDDLRLVALAALMVPVVLAFVVPGPHGSQDVDAEDRAVTQSCVVPPPPPSPPTQVRAGAKTSTRPVGPTIKVALSLHEALLALTSNGDKSGTGSFVRGINVMGGTRG